MPKSTIIFAIICLALAGATTAVVWWLVASGSADFTPTVRGDLSIGLPDDNQNGRDSRVQARNALVWDTQEQVIRFEENAFEQVPIASITKLMTAMVAMDVGIGWDDAATINPNEYVVGGRLLLHNGEHVTMRDLWHASLMGSANNATLALVRLLDTSEQDFVRAMNRKAIEIGLEQTEFVDVTGLNPANVSTAYEVARMVEFAFDRYPMIAQTTALKEYNYVVGGSGREHVLNNSNKLISEQQVELAGGKTGYLYEAKYCLVAQGEADLGKRIAVVLGSPSEDISVQTVKSLLHLDYGGF